MEIRPAQKKDIRPLAELWAHAFPGERTVEQRIRQLEAGGVYGGIETAWISGDGGHAQGAFRAYRLQQYLHGGVVPMMGLAAVAVAAPARRRGQGAELCRTALSHARERGDVLSVLYPFRPSFYEALGWGLAGTMLSCRFHPDSLPLTHTTPGVVELRDAAAVIAQCYDRVAPGMNGMIARTSRIWRQHLDWPDVHVYGLMRGIECAGYAIVHHGTQPHPDDRQLTIRELIAVDDDAYDELMSWIALQRNQWRIVQYEARHSERLDLRLTEPRSPGGIPARALWAEVAREIRGPMVRVVNAQLALEARQEWGTHAADCSFTLRVSDGDLPENRGPFNVVFTGGRARLTGGEPLPNSIDVGAPAFAQIFVGEMSVSEAVRLGKARVTGDMSVLDALFEPRSEFVLLDEF
jgi:predicted acetyltransferase